MAAYRETWGCLSSRGREGRKETGHHVVTPKCFVPFSFCINLKQKSSVRCYAMSSFLYAVACMAVKWDGKSRSLATLRDLAVSPAGACQPSSSGGRFWRFRSWWAATWAHGQFRTGSPGTMPGSLLRLVPETPQPRSSSCWTAFSDVWCTRAILSRWLSW